jgi:hypothetical protein
MDRRSWSRVMAAERRRPCREGSAKSAYREITLARSTDREYIGMGAL